MSHSACHTAPQQPQRAGPPRLLPFRVTTDDSAMETKIKRRGKEGNVCEELPGHDSRAPGVQVSFQAETSPRRLGTHAVGTSRPPARPRAPALTQPVRWWPHALSGDRYEGDAAARPLQRGTLNAGRLRGSSREIHRRACLRSRSLSRVRVSEAKTKACEQQVGFLRRRHLSQRHKALLPSHVCSRLKCNFGKMAGNGNFYIYLSTC